MKLTNRPLKFNDYIGQERIKNQLKVTIGACVKAGGKELPHMLFSGGAGLGKTTIAKIIANEYGVRYHEIMASSLNEQRDLVNLLSKLSDDRPDILFVDEIHRLNIKLEELLYPVMEDFIFEGDYKENGSNVKKRFWVPRFTLIGATTLAGELTKPLRDRFGIHFNMQSYNVDETKLIIKNLALKESINITDEATEEIAKRSKGVARIAINYFRRCVEFALVNTNGVVNKEATTGQFYLLGIDEMGLDGNDYTVLEYLGTQTNPVGLDTIATATNIDKGTVANIIEPYLMQKGLITRTSRGRQITDVGLNWVCDNTELTINQVIQSDQGERLERITSM